MGIRIIDKGRFDPFARMGGGISTPRGFVPRAGYDQEGNLFVNGSQTSRQKNRLVANGKPVKRFILMTRR